MSHRVILTALALTLLLGVAGGVAIPYLYPTLPDPAVADREGLLRWLVLRDLSQETPEVQRVLARRLEEECRCGVDWEATSGELDPAQRQQVWDNVQVLLKPWFMDKQDRYFKLDRGDRTEYLDRLLDTFAAWQGVESLGRESLGSESLGGDQTDAGGSSAEGNGLREVLLAQVQQWKEGATSQQRKQIDQFLWAIQSRWLMRSLKQLATGAEN